MENTEANAIAVLANPVKDVMRGDLVAVHEDYKIQDLEIFQGGRERARGVLKTPTMADFKSFVIDAQFGDAPVFVDHKNVTATCILNYSDGVYEQGHCDHKAILQLEPTVVWSKLNALKDRKLSQRDFAVFLEDWVSVLEITDAAGNVIGGGDWAQDRLVPDLVRAATLGQALVVRNPGAIRPWQHVLEPLSGYLRLAQLLWQDATLAQAWNFGPGNAGEVSVQTLTERLAHHWQALRVEHDASAQPHEAAVLRLDASAAQEQLAWRPVWSLDETLERTARWYLSYHERGQLSSMDDLAAYTAAAQRQGLEWAQ